MFLRNFKHINRNWVLNAFQSSQSSLRCTQCSASYGKSIQSEAFSLTGGLRSDYCKRLYRNRSTALCLTSKSLFMQLLFLSDTHLRTYATKAKVALPPKRVNVSVKLRSTTAQNGPKEATQASKDDPKDSKVVPVTKAKKRKIGRNVRVASVNKNGHEQEKAAKLISFNKNLLSFLEVQIFSGKHIMAYKSFMHYRRRALKQAPGSMDIAIYNAVIRGYSPKADWKKTKEIFSLILKDGLKPNPQSYAGLLECLGRSTETQSGNIRKVIQALEANGHKLDDIFNQCYFEKDQREVILAAVRQVHPSFTPTMLKPSEGYACPLLRHLNGSNTVFQSPCRDLITLEELKLRAKTQLRNELEGSVTIKSIQRRDSDEENAAQYRDVLQELENQWTEAIQKSVLRHMQSLGIQLRRAPSPWGVNLFPFLNALNVDEYVKIIVLEIRKLAEGSETYSPEVTRLHREIGMQVLSRFQVLHKKDTGILDKIDAMYEKYTEWYLNPSLHPSANVRERWQEFLCSSFVDGPTTDSAEKAWSPSVLSNIGSFLYKILMRDVKIDANLMKPGSKTPQIVPAFYSIFRMQGSHLKEEIKPHPVLVKLFQAASKDELTFPTTLVPMECPPLPWASVYTGGYLLSAAKLVRLPPQSQQQINRLEDSNPATLYPALDSLNQLGCVPWKINQEVLDIVIEVFNNKGDESIGIPPPPSECPAPPIIDSKMTKEETMAAHKQRLLLKRRKAEMYSLWCDALYRFSLANHYRDRIFWLPHNMDFRGRVYPCPPHLSHLGADPARSLLVFAQGRELGPQGLDWLKIHLINLTGLQKRNSLEDRLAYADSILSDIIDSAKNPLRGKRWWMESEEPWQTLACCLEITKAIESGNPANYVSHFPIHQDGSCNGLQHYAALGRDEAGAESVNLSPSIKPQDVYNAVATLVEKQRSQDAVNGVRIAQVLEGFISRKVIKQTVMTTVYGVTRYGARLQIAKQLKDLNGFPPDDVWAGSLYLTHKTFDSLQEMFTSTKEIQDWFTECARLLSQVRGKPVEWVTPIGLPVVQPYYKISKARQDTDPSRLADSLCINNYEKPNVMKQKNAFPPNFIHSLDSTHMMLTSLHCERAGITFVSVHDCYWTHPASVHIMSRVCREQFVALHSQPILEDLSEYLFSKFGFDESKLLHSNSLVEASKMRLNSLLKEVPPKGKFDLNKVLESLYFFS